MIDKTTNGRQYVISNAKNGLVLRTHSFGEYFNDDEEIIVYQEDETTQAFVEFLSLIVEDFGPSYDKFTNEPINIQIRLVPGSKADFIHHIKSFLSFYVPLDKDQLDMLASSIEVTVDSYLDKTFSGV